MGVEECLAAPSPPAALAQYLLTCSQQLGALTRMVRTALPDLHRRTLAALITIDVHARDIVDNLIRSALLSVCAHMDRTDVTHVIAQHCDELVQHGLLCLPYSRLILVALPCWFQALWYKTSAGVCQGVCDIIGCCL